MPANEIRIPPDRIFKSAYAALAATTQNLPFEIDCRSGCAHCCKHLMIATFHLSEAKIALDYAREHFDEEQFARIETQIRRNRETIAAAEVKKMDDYTALDVPCAFLDENQCSIYEARPFACRATVSESEPACREYLIDKIPADSPEAKHKDGTGPIAQRWGMFVSMQLKKQMTAGGAAEQNFEWNEALVQILDGHKPSDSHDPMIQDSLLAIGQSLQTAGSAAATSGQVKVNVSFDV